MNLTGKQKQFLRGLAHKLKPVVIIGEAGLSESVMAEIENSINHHELIKIKFPAMDKAEREQWFEQISDSLEAAHVQTIGRIAVFFRPSEKQKISLPRS